MSEPVLKTSQEWAEELFEKCIIDPDGWDRSNFPYSWYKEPITLEEFNRRMSFSTHVSVITKKK